MHRRDLWPRKWGRYGYDPSLRQDTERVLVRVRIHVKLINLGWLQGGRGIAYDDFFPLLLPRHITIFLTKRDGREEPRARAHDFTMQKKRVSEREALLGVGSAFLTNGVAFIVALARRTLGPPGPDRKSVRESCAARTVSLFFRLYLPGAQLQRV